MLKGFPSFGVANLAKLDAEKEETSPSGAVKTTMFDTATEVVMECSAVLRIIKHARDAQPHKVFGHLLGIQLGKTIEVSCALPSVQTNVYASGMTEEERDEKDERDEQRTLQLTRASNMGSLVVGRYTGASHSSYFNTRNLHTMMDGLKSGNPCLLLVYDPLRTQLGKLYLRAYTPSPAYLALYAQAGNQRHLASGVLLERVGAEGLLTEIPIKFNTSQLGRMVLHNHFATRPRNVTNLIVDQGGVERYTEKTLHFLAEGMDKLRGDLNQRSFQMATATGPVPLRVDTLVQCKQLTDQAEHIANMSKGVTLNLHFANQIPQ